MPQAVMRPVSLRFVESARYKQKATSQCSLWLKPSLHAGLYGVNNAAKGGRNVKGKTEVRGLRDGALPSLPCSQ